MRNAVLSASLLCLLIPQASRAEPIKDPAELMPAGTLAYLELNQPGPLAKEIASLLEGTAFANVPDSLLDLFEKMKVQPSRGQREEMGAIGLVFSPEVVKEIQRLQGAAIAVTSIANGKPEFVAVVLPGESNAPTFLMRLFVTMERTRAVGEVEGVKLYQYAPHRGFQPQPFKPDQPKRGEQPIVFQREESSEPTFAMMSGVLMIGTTDAVKETIRRAKGKSGDPSLASLNKYKEVRKEIGGSGLFAYVDLAGAVAAMEKVLPKFEAQLGADFLKAIDQMVNFKAFRAAGYSVTLEKGTLRYRELVLLDPKEKSPILELLPTEAVKSDLLHFTPSDSTIFAALSNNNGAERWTLALKMCDAVSKLNGGKMPSEDLAKMEKALGIDIAKDVMGKITGISASLGDLTKAPVRRIEEEGPGFKRTRSMPEVPFAIAIQTTDNAAAEKVVDVVLIKVLGAMLNKQDAKPEIKEVGGYKLSYIPVDRQGGVYYGREGKTIVLGMFPTPVAQALSNGAKQKGWLSEAKVKSRSKEFEDSVMVFATRPVSLLAIGMFTYLMETHSAERRAIEAVPPEREKPQREEKPKIKETVEKPMELPKELKELLEKEEWLVGRVVRKGDRIMEEWTLPGLKPLVGRAMQFAVEMSMQNRKQPPPFPETRTAPPSPDRKP